MQLQGEQAYAQRQARPTASLPEAMLCSGPSAHICSLHSHTGPQGKYLGPHFTGVDFRGWRVEVPTQTTLRCCRIWMRNRELASVLENSAVLGAPWHYPSPDVWRVPPGPWTQSSGPPCPRGSGLLQLLGAMLAGCPPECEVLPEGVPGGNPWQTPAAE